MPDSVIRRGGENTERVYLHDADFVLADGSRVVVARSDFPKAPAGTEDVISRHKARYGLVALFCRPGKHVLDVPCGSGYAADFLKPLGIGYQGIDIDLPTIQYACRMHGGSHARFGTGDMQSPDFGAHRFDIVSCIEGLEHIEQQYQGPLISALHSALVPGGILIVSSPEPTSGRSGPSSHNPDHKWELARDDLVALLTTYFRQVEIVSQPAIGLSTGITTRCLYGICHRDD